MSICAPPRNCGSRRRRRSDRPASPPRPELIQLWRRQIGCRLRLGEERGPRPFVLVGYQSRGRVADSLVPISQLTFFSLFDEPTESFDAEGIATVHAILGKLAREGRTIIVISHDPRIVKGRHVVLDLNTKPVPTVANVPGVVANEPQVGRG